MKIFNPLPGHRPHDSIEIVSAPVGQLRIYCEERIEEADSGLLIPYLGATSSEVEVPYHRGCFTRTIVGSVAHQLGRCSCYGGDGEDSPGISKRESAKMAEALAHHKARRAVN